MPSKAELSTLFFPIQQDWDSWLKDNHAQSPGIWLKIAKKETGIPSVSYLQAVETALCYGWIDGQKASLDEHYWLQKFTPRTPKSLWSQVNRDKAEELIAQGRMQPAGLLEVEKARADGRWEAAYASQSKISAPPEFQAALERSPAAQAFFDTLNSANRYAILYRITTAKKPATRATRIQKFIEMLEKGEKLYP